MVSRSATPGQGAPQGDHQGGVDGDGVGPHVGFVTFMVPQGWLKKSPCPRAGAFQPSASVLWWVEM